VVERDERAALAAFDAALNAIPDGQRMARALARRLVGINCVLPAALDPNGYSRLSEGELRSRLAGPLAVARTSGAR
jgi:hypothetical protein